MSQTERNDRFIEHLIQNRDDRALMASLRRGLGQRPGTVPEVSRIVEYWDVPDWQKDVYYMIGPLFAFHHRNGENDVTNDGNMGNHFRELCEDPNELPPSIERRFMQLLASDKNALGDALRPVISLLRSKSVAINWYKLLQDVLDWQDTRYEEKRVRVQRKWASAFWRTTRPTNQQPNS